MNMIVATTIKEKIEERESVMKKKANLEKTEMT